MRCRLEVRGSGSDSTRDASLVKETVGVNLDGFGRTSSLAADDGAEQSTRAGQGRARQGRQRGGRDYVVGQENLNLKRRDGALWCCVAICVPARRSRWVLCYVKLFLQGLRPRHTAHYANLLLL